MVSGAQSTPLISRYNFYEWILPSSHASVTCSLSKLVSIDSLFFACMLCTYIGYNLNYFFMQEAMQADEPISCLLDSRDEAYSWLTGDILHKENIGTATSGALNRQALVSEPDTKSLETKRILFKGSNSVPGGFLTLRVTVSWKFKMLVCFNILSNKFYKLNIVFSCDLSLPFTWSDLYF